MIRRDPMAYMQAVDQALDRGERGAPSDPTDSTDSTDSTGPDPTDGGLAGPMGPMGPTGPMGPMGVSALFVGDAKSPHWASPRRRSKQFWNIQLRRCYGHAVELRLGITQSTSINAGLMGAQYEVFRQAVGDLVRTY